MRKKLFATTLVVAGLIAATSGANAATTTASQTLQCTLGSYINITPDSSAVTSSTIDIDTGALANPLTSKFNFQLNSPQTLYLKASTQSATTTEKAFFKNGSNIYVVLSNITNKPTVAAITDAKSATPNSDNNANVIAYNVTGVTLSGASSSATPNYNNTTNQYEIAGSPGTSGATTTIASTVVPNTYSFMDTAGTYQAVVTLTSSAT